MTSYVSSVMSCLFRWPSPLLDESDTCFMKNWHPLLSCLLCLFSPFDYFLGLILCISLLYFLFPSLEVTLAVVLYSWFTVSQLFLLQRASIPFSSLLLTRLQPQLTFALLSFFPLNHSFRFLTLILVFIVFFNNPDYFLPSLPFCLFSFYLWVFPPPPTHHCARSQQRWPTMFRIQLNLYLTDACFFSTRISLPYRI